MQNIDIAALLPKVECIVREVGLYIQTQRESFTRQHIEHKGPGDLVSYVDKTADKMLSEQFAELISGCGFINEESGNSNDDSPYIWIIDPLDGTTNFVHEIPFYCVSVALQKEKTTVLACVFEVIRKEMFTAILGKGAWLNGFPLRVTETVDLKNGLIATGFPFRHFQNLDNYLFLLRDMLRSARGLRRLGSAALDLSYVAAGRFDAFFETNLSPWDVAAGALLVQEAGGIVTDHHGKNDFVFGKSILATNANLYSQIFDLLQKHAPTPK